MKKKILIVLIAVCTMLFAFGMINASAKIFDEKLMYEINNRGTITILRCDRNAISITLPESIEGISVTEISEFAFQSCNNLTEIVIPDSITSIERFAFSLCENLKCVKIGKGVTVLEDSAFSGCENLTDVQLGERIEEIGSNAFSDCSSLTEIVIPDSVMIIDAYAFDCENLEIAHIGTGVKYINNDAFPYSLKELHIKDLSQYINIDFTGAANPLMYHQTTLYLNGETIKNAVIPSGTTTIPDYAFYGCGDLESISIPDSVKKIGRSAFENCTKLASVSIPDSVSIIDGAAFQGCSNLSMASIGNNVAYIGGRAFSNCSNLENISIPDSVEYIGDYSFSDCTLLKDICLGSGIKHFGANAFRNCDIEKVSISDIMFYWVASGNFITDYGDKILLNGEPITNVVIPDGITYIPDYAFFDCNTIESVSIPAGVNSIGFMAFANCKSLTEVFLPDSLTEIGNYAFRGCNGLKSITIPDSVVTIGHSAFEFCENLEKVLLGSGVNFINNYAFRDCYLLYDINIPETIEYIGHGAFWFTKYINELPSDENGVVYIGTHLINVKDKTLSEYVIKDGTTSISDLAFANCVNLENIVIPDSVKTIGTAFMRCAKLKDIVIPDTVESIAKDAFEDTAYIKDASNWDNGIFYAGNHLLKADAGIVECVIRKGTKSISANAFARCYQIENVVIPDGVNYINPSVFSDCDNLKSVVLPASIIKLEHSAFRWCDNLTEIHISDMDAYLNIDFGYSESIELDGFAMFFLDVLYLNNEQVTSFVVPEYIKKIYSRAFDGCENLLNITLPEGITFIGEAAFRGCFNLTMLTIPKSVTTINPINWNIHKINIKDISAFMKIEFYDNYGDFGADLFYQNEPLTDLVVPDNVTHIPSGMFSSCSSLKSIVLPDSVTYIGERAFGYCENLEHVTIGSSVRYIGRSAFESCDALKQLHISGAMEFIDSNSFAFCENIDYILYDGDIDKWNKIHIDNGNVALKTAKIYFDGNNSESLKAKTKTELSADGKSFTITPINIETGKTVILALYDGEKFIEMQSAVYIGEVVPFTTTKSYTNAKVMVWDDITNLKPICEIENVL